MKIKKIIISSLLLVLTLQFNVFAGDNSLRKVSNADPASAKEPIKMEFKDGCKHCHHLSRSAINILKNKYGIKKEAIEKAISEGKTIFDVAKDNKITVDQLKSLIISPKMKAIDEMVVTGELTKENADKMKSKFKEMLDKWDGKIEPKNFKKDNTKNSKDNKSTDSKVQ